MQHSTVSTADSLGEASSRGEAYVRKGVGRELGKEPCEVAILPVHQFVDSLVTRGHEESDSVFLSQRSVQVDQVPKVFLGLILLWYHIQPLFFALNVCNVKPALCDITATGVIHARSGAVSPYERRTA